jgi:hypothetical protein
MKVQNLTIGLGCLLVVSSCAAPIESPDQTPTVAQTSAGIDETKTSSSDQHTVDTSGPPGLLEFDPTRIDTNFEGLTELIHRRGIAEQLNQGLSFTPNVPGIKNVSDDAIAKALGVELAYRGASKHVKGMGPFDRIREGDVLRLSVSSRSRTASGAPLGLTVVTAPKVENSGAAKWTDGFLARLGITAGCEGTAVQSDTMGMGSGGNEIWFMNADAERRCLIAGREVLNLSARVSIEKQGALSDLTITWPEITGYLARTDGAKWTEAGLREFIAAEVFKLREHSPPVDYIGIGYMVRDGLLVPTISVGGVSGNTKGWGDWIELGRDVRPR